MSGAGEADEGGGDAEASRAAAPLRPATIGRWLGPVLAAAVFATVPDASLAFEGRAVLALMTWMATWWVTEAVPVPVTALLPVAVLPLVTVLHHGSAAAATQSAATPYANRFIGLFMGGFILALAMERWGLHRRIALTALRCAGTRPRGIVAVFMIVTAVLSMWVSNTATAVMMLPIAASVLGLAARGEGDAEDDVATANLGRSLMLGIAYAASIGGIGTLIGTPPNTVLAGFVQERYGIEIGFAAWMRIGLPVVFLMLPLAWATLTWFVYPPSSAPIRGGSGVVRGELAQLGPMSRGERTTMIVFLLTAGAWILRPQLQAITVGGMAPLAGLDDTQIAIAAAIVLFVLPGGRRDGRRDGPGERVMDWETARRLPWGILLLFGGGLSLAAAVQEHGVAEWIGARSEALAGLPGVLVVLAVVAGVIFLTELTSNTATTATLLPILAGLAPTLGIDPPLLLVPAALAASCAFMMPVATPPNAIVFSSGRVTIAEMCRAGIVLNLVGIAVITAIGYALVGTVAATVLPAPGAGG